MRLRSASENTPAIAMQDLNKSYGESHVLRGVDLDVEAGQKVAFIGRSGSGKTTLLRLLMTLEEPDSGIIHVHGVPLGVRLKDGEYEPDRRRHIAEVRRNIGMVFQHFNLFPHKTALQNVMEAPVHVLKLSKDEARMRGVELLEQVGLGHKVDEYPSRLSGGQQQRVAIARALAMRPQVMLFDEVTSALDPEVVGEVLSVIRDIAHETSMTMLLVTHEMRFARSFADRVIYMEHGVVAEDSPPDVIFENPTNPSTRNFLRAVLDH
ncbi:MULTISPECIES: ectoine/hydroxyectoine ABC transporter ATP-binding protein EhuA [unclassified Nocardioides]|uniref:ectoine/hydroxyectoine ABC transporter ATP-binding protein EhuA n=1 Tax=unclassified Nocardioides TaxID=2615069 RepID=UPI000A26F716|nr:MULTISPECIES: ectoine/hydroxyectoine ABC transporter ATP-binding protein EhuA [unclassified Nocardioides]